MKPLKKLIIPLAVMAVLVIALVIYLIVSKSGSDEPVAVNKDVLDINPTLISQLSVYRKNDPEDIVIDMSYSNATDSYTYVFNGDAETASQYSDTTLSSFIVILSSYSVNSIIENPASISEYGLDDPEIIVNITTTDGQTYKVLLGDDTYEGANCYMKIDGDDSVYTVAVAKKYYANYKEIDFLKSQVLNIDYSKIATVQFDRNTDDTHIKATCEIYEESGSPQYYVFEPFTLKASTYFEKLMEYICTLEIAKFIEIPEDQLSNYGMADPAFHFVITMDDGSKTELYISENLGEFYYGKLAGTNNYFMLSEAQISGLETPLLTLLSSYISYYAASEISSVTGSYNGETFRFELDVAPGGAYSDEDSVVKLDNRNAVIYNSNGRTYASVLFESLATIMIGGIDTTAHPKVSDSIMTLTFVTKEYQTLKFDFVPKGSDQYYVMQNDQYTSFYVNAAELFHDGGQDTYNYGVWPAYQLLDTAIRNNANGIYDIPG